MSGELNRARSHFAYYMGRAAGTASRIGLDRIATVLMLMGRTPTETYDMPPAEAGYMREALELLAERWLPLELFRCDLHGGPEEAEMREELQSAIGWAAAIERAGDPPGAIAP